MKHDSKDLSRVTIITLCGSTRFKDDFLYWNKRLTLAGAIILMPGVFAHSGDKITKEEKVRLDQLHRRKITISDGIFVINKDGYIGDSTKQEIAFAEGLGVPVFYASDMVEERE